MTLIDDRRQARSAGRLAMLRSRGSLVTCDFQCPGRELASLQVQTKGFEESYGLDNLHLTVAKAYLTKLLANVRVVRWLAQNKPEYLSEFQSIAELTNLPTEISAAAE
jgi:hypothetical protein